MLTTFQVIQKIGLCICVYDVLSASDGLIGHGTGIVNVNGVPKKSGLQCPYIKRFLVEFRLIVFRPFKGEIVLGQISSASEYGMKSTFPSPQNGACKINRG